MGNQNGQGSKETPGIPSTERNNKEITPITFQNTHHTAHQQQLSQSNSNKETNNFTQLSRYTGNNTISKSSVRMDATLNLNNLSVIMQNQQFFNGKDQTSVPFSVVKLSMDKKVSEVIQNLHPQFFNQFADKPNSKQSHWKINSKGYYIKIILPKRIAIMKPGFLYFGQFLSQSNDFIPHGYGRLFDQKGMYLGNFNHGEAHGQGVYSDNSTGTVSKGTWISGQIRSGEVTNKYYKYQGQFVNGIAEGRGVLQYSEHKASYKGNFHQGQYEDENGYFQCQQYDYSGGFRQGKKEGIGCLIEKQRIIKGKNKRYKPQQQFQGYFENDYYKGRKRSDK